MGGSISKTFSDKMAENQKSIYCFSIPVLILFPNYLLFSLFLYLPLSISMLRWSRNYEKNKYLLLFDGCCWLSRMKLMFFFCFCKNSKYFQQCWQHRWQPDGIWFNGWGQLGVYLHQV